MTVNLPAGPSFPHAMETVVRLGPESVLLLVRITGMLKETLSMTKKKYTKIQTKSILTIFLKTLIVVVVILSISVY